MLVLEAATRPVSFSSESGNSDVKAIIATIGDLDSNQLLDRLDFDLIRSNPKILMGYSDITVLLIGNYRMTGLVTFLGPAILPQFEENGSPRQSRLAQPLRARVLITRRVGILREGPFMARSPSCSAVDHLILWRSHHHDPFDG